MPNGCAQLASFSMRTGVLYRGFFLDVKWAGRGYNYSRPSVAEVKNAWSYSFSAPIYLHGMPTDDFTCS